MSAQLTGEGEGPSAQRFHSILQAPSFSLITRFAGAVHLAAIAIPGPASQRPANGAAAEIPASLPLPPAARSRNSPAGGSTVPLFLRKKRDRKTPLVFLPPSLPERFLIQSVAPLVCIFFGVHFPKSRPDPILLPESFCLPLRLRKARPLSGHSSGPYSLFSPVFVQAAQEATDRSRCFLYT